MVSRCPVSLDCGLVSRKVATTERRAFVQEMTGLTALQLSGLVLIAYVHFLHYSRDFVGILLGVQTY